MAIDLLDKIQDTEKAISDKKKESIELKEKQSKTESEFNALLKQNQSDISNLQERKYRLGRAQYDDANKRATLVDFGLNSNDAELTDYSLIVKESENDSDQKAIDALLELDKAFHAKNDSNTNSQVEMMQDNSEGKMQSAEDPKVTYRRIESEELPEELQPMISSDEITGQLQKKKVFISHSSKDVAAVKQIVELLELLGFNDGNMFCSSIEPYGIPNDTDIYEYLKNQFNEFDLHVIFVLSKNYYNSPACLNEMGAAWVLSCSKTVMLLPEFDFSDIDGAINPRKIAIQFKTGLSSTELYNLKSRITSFINDMSQLSGNTPHIREEKRDSFIDALNTYTDSKLSK